jgi:outer membrane protein assembly factor BamB
VKKAIALLVVLMTGAACGKQPPLVKKPVFPMGRSWDLAPDIDSDELIQFLSLTSGANGLVLISSHAGELRAMDCATGVPRWTVRDAPGSVAVSESLVILVNQSGGVRALDSRSGEELWHAQTQVTDPLTPWTDGQRVFIAGQGLVALDARSGAVLWTLGDREFASPPRLAGDLAVLSDKQGALHAFNAASGRLLWTHKTGSAITAPVAGGQDGRLYVGTANGWFLALKKKNGKIAWRWRVGVGMTFTAVLHEKTVLFHSHDAVLYAFNKRNGHMLWRVPLPSRPLGPPLFFQDVLLVPCFGAQEGRSTLIGIDIKGGQRVGVYDAPAEMAVPPAACGEQVILALRDQTVLSVATLPPTPTPSPSPVPSPAPTATVPTSPTVAPTPSASGSISPSPASTVTVPVNSTATPSASGSTLPSPAPSAFPGSPTSTS